MTISLEAIRFNHDPNSATRDAFTIRRNQTQDVVVPEWRRGTTTLPEHSPAAYRTRQISANNLTIEAQFRRDDGDPTSVQINATGRTGNVLGNVKPRTINFTRNLSAFERFELDSQGQNPAVGVFDICWDWFANGAALQTTDHRIYTIVEEPQDPWSQPGSSVRDFQLPWTDVLEQACRAAAGARNADEAADMLTQWVFSLGDTALSYDELGSGSTNFTIPGMQTFKCTKFLQVLTGELPTPASVNCTDCATILSSFANILGCSLTQSRIGNDFLTNRIKKIGPNAPIRQSFRFHEVAWKFQPAGVGASIYDCCLQVDGDADPTNNPFRPQLGINMPLGAPGSEGYQFRLIAPNGNGPEEYREMNGSRMRRKIEGSTTTRSNIDPEQLRGLEKEYGFSDWKFSPSKPIHLCGSRYADEAVASEISTSAQRLFLKNYNFQKGLRSPEGWTPGVVESFEAGPDPLRLTDVVWSKKYSKAALRVLTYECSSITAARSFLLSLLAEFHLRDIKRRLEFVVGHKKVKIGDVAFAGPDDLVLLFARANNVVLIQNVGTTLVPVAPFAHAVDTDMTSPDPQTEHVVEMNQFYVSNEQIRVGQEVPIHTKSEQITNEKGLLLKFITPAGQVFTKGDDLLYQPRQPGQQSITILAHKAGEKSAKQMLSLFAEP